MQLIRGYNLGGINVHMKQVVMMKTAGAGPRLKWGTELTEGNA